MLIPQFYHVSILQLKRLCFANMMWSIGELVLKLLTRSSLRSGNAPAPNGLSLFTFRISADINALNEPKIYINFSSQRVLNIHLQ